MKDHRILGRELRLFGTDPLIGAGMPYLLPAGAAIRNAVEEYLRTVERKAGYQHVYSPPLGKQELYEISGHWAHYRDEMFPPMAVGGENVVLRPSLCPHHALIFRSQERSYRELPLRMAELGSMHRLELSGVLGGLSRVRSIQLNDAHIFCQEHMVIAEAASALHMIQDAYSLLGIRPAYYRLSLGKQDSKYVDNPKMWLDAKSMLVGVLNSMGVDYQESPGEAAFYGPKIDVQVVDSGGRELSLSTVQIDFYQPEQFNLRYKGSDGKYHRPVIIHHAIVGSIERMLAHLIEVHAGAFPAWLAPVQLAVMPVSDSELSAAKALLQQAIDSDIRAELIGPEHGSLGARIRTQRLVPYQAVIGPSEAALDQVSIRLRDGRQLGSLPSQQALVQLRSKIEDHSIDLW